MLPDVVVCRSTPSALRATSPTGGDTGFWGKTTNIVFVPAIMRSCDTMSQAKAQSAARTLRNKGFRPATKMRVYRQSVLFLITGYVIVAVFSSRGDGFLAVQYSVLERYHHLVQLAEQRHQLLYSQPFGI